MVEEGRSRTVGRWTLCEEIQDWRHLAGETDQALRGSPGETARAHGLVADGL